MVTQADIDRLTWFHDFDFPGGLKARSAESNFVVMRRILQWFVGEELKALNFTGKRVIDIGCWDGYFSFLAEERGAASVLAVDDASQNWGTPECFLLAKELKASQVRLLPDVSVYDLARQINDTFDIILYFGVYYHLHAPYLAFAQIRALCHASSVLVVEGECFRDDQQATADIDVRDPRAPSMFTPTTRLLLDMLRSCYFEVERVAYVNDLDVTEMLALVPPSDVLRLLALHRQIKRSREARGVSGHEASPVRTPERVVIFARPVIGRNEYHQYRPPFGLDHFDEPGRFSAPS